MPQRPLDFPRRPLRNRLLDSRGCGLSRDQEETRGPGLRPAGSLSRQHPRRPPAPGWPNPTSSNPRAGRFNSLRLHPHLEARLRQDPESAGASLALQALLRRDDFDPSARLELFADLARHFRAKVTFRAETTDGISDEQYVRNVVDILFRSRAENRRLAPERKT